MFEVSREGALCVCRTCHQTKQMVATSSSVIFFKRNCMFRRAIWWKYPKSAGIRLLRCHASPSAEKACSPGEAQRSLKPDEGVTWPNWRAKPEGPILWKDFWMFSNTENVSNWKLAGMRNTWCLLVLLASLFRNWENSVEEILSTGAAIPHYNLPSLVSTPPTRCCFHLLLSTSQFGGQHKTSSLAGR